MELEYISQKRFYNSALSKFLMNDYIYLLIIEENKFTAYVIFIA